MDKVNTHIVIKREDVQRYLSEEEKQTLEKLLDVIAQGRSKNLFKPANNYYICNQDEPYAELVHGVIMYGESVKKQQEELLGKIYFHS